MTTTSHLRTVSGMSETELVMSAKTRYEATIAKFGADSPQARAVLARWGRYLDTRAAGDDVMALADSLGVSRHLVANAAAERAYRTGGAA